MRRFLIYALTGFLFFFFQITGYDLAKDGNIVWTVGYTLGTLALAAAGGALFGALAMNVPRIISQLDGVRAAIFPAKKTQAGKSCSFTPRRVWLISFCLIVLCWLPAYLAYYPGICAYDVTIQTGQIESGAYNDHHPLAHTLLLAGSMKLGEGLFCDANTGIALLTLVQMLFLAGTLAYGIAFLYKRKVAAGWLTALTLLGMFYPFHLYISISVIKDVFFSAFFFLMTLFLYELILERKKRVTATDLAFFVSAIGVQLFRNNGRYAMLVLLVVLFAAIVFGKNFRLFWGRLALNCMLSLIVGSLLLSGLFRVTGAEQGDRREMLSMPIQQFARCMLYHGGVGVLEEDDGAMEEQDRNLINDFLLDEGYRAYRPEISDPVKSHTNTYVVRYRAGDFVKTYVRLLGSFPGEFINAALAVNAGYLYVGDVSHANINKNGVDKGLGYVQTRWVDRELNPRGIYQDSKWEGLHAIMERWADENRYLSYPVLRLFFAPGIFLWLYLTLTGRLLARKKYDLWVPLSLAFGYYATLFLGPTVQLRYLYPLMLVIPYAALICISDGKEKE